MARYIDHSNQLNLGKVIYNDFEFPPAINSSAKMAPVYDRSDRGLMYVLYSIRIEFILTLQDLDSIGSGSSGSGDNWEDSNSLTSSNTATGEQDAYTHDPSQPSTVTGGHLGAAVQSVKGGVDHAMAFLRRRLTQPGRKLQISGIGLGPDLTVNHPSQTSTEGQNSLHDVVWGPKPRELTWEPIGGNSAVRVVWDCEVGLVECEELDKSDKERRPLGFGSNPTSSGNQLPMEVLQLVYNESWDITPEGLTTKKYSAVIQIRGYIDYASLKNVITSADQYRLFFEPVLQEGYKRTRSYKLNDDKTQLDITITDKEIESDWPYPPGVTDMDCNYTISSALSGEGELNAGAAFRGWRSRIAGSMTLAKGTHPYWRRVYPYVMFLTLIRSRYLHINKGLMAGAAAGATMGGIQSALGGTSAKPVEVFGQMPFNMPISFDLSEDIYGRTFSFSFEWFTLLGHPSQAVSFLNFGYAPNIYYEHQNKKQTNILTRKRNPNVLYDWSFWIHSIIGQLKKTTDDNAHYRGSYFKFSTSVTVNFEQTKTFTILERWRGKGAPMSLRGASWDTWEGDERMEPCQDNEQFSYDKTIDEGGIGTDDVPISNILSTHDNLGNNVFDYKCEVEVVENNQVVTAMVLNNPEEYITLQDHQHGESSHDTVMGKRPVNNTLQTGEVIYVEPERPNYLGDTNTVYNPVEINYSPTSKMAPKTQAVGPPQYTLRVVGYSITSGLPINPPRVSEYGTSPAVRLSNNSSVCQISAGQCELWQTKWVQTYALLGTPNGVKPQASDVPWLGDVPKSPIYSNGHTTQRGIRGTT